MTLRTLASLVVLVWLLPACRDGDARARAAATRGPLAAQEAHDATTTPPPDPVAQLRAFEDDRRRNTDFAALPPSDHAMGADPYDVAALPGDSAGQGERFVGILRGADAIVLLDRDGHELARADAPRSPTGLAVAASGGDVYVSGENASTIARYRVGTSIEQTGTIDMDGALGIVDIALGQEGVLYAVEEMTGRLLAVSLAGPGSPAGPSAEKRSAVRSIARCRGPLRVVRAGSYVLVDCLLEHAVEVFRVDRRGFPASEPVARIQHDGPMWSLATLVTDSRGENLLIAIGGVEDHALDRSDGSFGYIDSFVYVYGMDGASGQVTRQIAIDVSEHGLVTPKWLALSRAGSEQDKGAGEGGQGGAIVVDVAGYGTSGRLRLAVPPPDSQGTERGDAQVGIEALSGDLPPGTNAITFTRNGDGFLAANPLLDAWVAVGADGVTVTGAAAGPREGQPDPRGQAGQGQSTARSVPVRLGEALFFTTLLAPWNPASGQKSRFTCETCHFEGYGDGRIHYTGRGTVHATTKPLHGLFNNRPHFSRALDRTMAQMVHNEFRVANRGSGRDPWFSLDSASFPWLRQLGALPGILPPLYLRQAFMRFLMEYTHRSNPAVLGRSAFDARERAGAALFRDRCESCHRARLVADQPGSEVPFARWEALVLSPAGAIVWGSDEYRKTGVEPYVHPQGARVPSLRRVYRKWPYFTNGTARELGDVLARARFGADPGTGQAVFFHDQAATGSDPSGARLDQLEDSEIQALLAFLRLL